MRNTLLKGLALGLLLTTSARSATNIIDFNTNPTNSGLYALFGNVVGTNNLPAPWRPTGGASGGANDGYLAITDASGGSQSTLVFKDLENGLVLKAFTFECDIRIGGGTAVPADGFSINLASANDPSLWTRSPGFPFPFHSEPMTYGLFTSLCSKAIKTSSPTTGIIRRPRPSPADGLTMRAHQPSVSSPSAG